MKRYLNLYKALPIQVKASIVFLVCSFLQKGISTITTPIFTRVLTTDEYGSFSVFNSWMQIITPIVCLNLYSGVYSQGIVKFENDRRCFSSSLQGLSASLIMVWAIFYLITYNFWNAVFSLTTVQIFAMLIMIWANGAFAFWSMEQRVDFKYQKLALLTLTAAILQPAVGLAFIFNSEDRVTARIIGMALIQLILYSGTFASQMKRGKQFYSKKYWLYALKFNIPLLPHYLSQTVLASSDRIMIGRMVGDSEAGIYNLAYSIALLMTMVNDAMIKTVEPWIYRKLKEGKPGDIAHVAYPCFGMIAVLDIVLIMFAPEIVRIFAPAEYYNAIWVIPAVTMSTLFMFMYVFFATFEFFYERTKYIACATVGGALLNIVLNYICIQRFGYMAAGYTTLGCYILYASLHYMFMRKICNQFLDGIHPYKLKWIIAISLAFLAIGFGIMITYYNIWLRYGVICGLVLVTFAMRRRIKPILSLFVSIRKEKNG